MRGQCVNSGVCLCGVRVCARVLPFGRRPDGTEIIGSAYPNTYGTHTQSVVDSMQYRTSSATFGYSHHSFTLHDGNHLVSHVLRLALTRSRTSSACFSIQKYSFPLCARPYANGFGARHALAGNPDATRVRTHTNRSKCVAATACTSASIYSHRGQCTQNSASGGGGVKERK